MIFEHGLIRERERVAVEAKIRRCRIRAQQHKEGQCAEPAKTRTETKVASHQIKIAPTQRPFCLP